MTIYRDHRGHLQSVYKKTDYDWLTFKEDRFSYSLFGTLRGFHADNKTWKLCACVYGRIQLVYYHPKDGRTFSRIMDNNCESVLIPPGCFLAHLCLSTDCLLFYKWTEYYKDAGADKQWAVRYDDPTIDAKWLIKPHIFSDRDRNSGTLKELCLI